MIALWNTIVLQANQGNFSFFIMIAALAQIGLICYFENRKKK